MRFAFLLCAVAFTTHNSVTYAADPVGNLKVLTPIVAKTLAAYNQDNAKAFYAAWTKTDMQVGTQDIYNTFYKDKAKKELGNYKPASLALIEDDYKLEGKFITLHYKATFGKDVPGQITVNFVHEDGRYKLMYFDIRKQP